MRNLRPIAGDGSTKVDRREFVALGISAGLAASAARGERLMKPPFAEYADYDAVGLADLIRRREVSAAEVLEAAIARCEAVDPKVNAVVLRHFDLARQFVKQGLPEGPLTGVPFLLKDMGVGLGGTMTTQGGKLFQFKAERDSEAVARFRRAGLVIFGKGATPEMGAAGSTETRLYGATRNPWNLSKTTGGSSGGSCAAVAASIAPAAHASDGGGSIRAPASLCGIFGFKPSRGLTPEGSAWGVDHAVTRSVRDSATLLDALAGPEHGGMFFAPTPARPFVKEVGQAPGQLKIALFTGYEGYATHPECVVAARDAAKLCESLGHTVEEVNAPVDMADMGRQFVTLIRVLLAVVLDGKGAELGRTITKDDVEIGKWIAVETARKLDAVSYLKADWSVYISTGQMAQFFRNYDVLLSPTVGCPPPDLGVLNASKVERDSVELLIETYGAFTVPGSLAGIPGMSVPLYWTRDGLPIGTMFQSAFGNDALLLRLAGQLEQARPWIQRRPPLA